MTTILIIDDEAPIRANLRRFLVFEGYEVIEAENGRAGIEQLRTHQPAIVLCDLMMPEVDGYGVLEALRANPATAQIPFVFLTASAEKSERQSGLARGANGYLTKPFTLEELMATINNLLGS